MTVLSRGARVRRGGRRPGWVLLTALLVLAIAASSALVFTNRVELLKLAVILALWAAVVAAFVSVIYRRQSDVDQARARDLKLVYDLQLDREISARREYELTVESQLRRELASELRAQASDEVAALRAELAALRTNLEILFDAELSERPALETERRTVRGYSDWDRDNESARERISRVTSVRAEEPHPRADDSSIIDVPEEPLVPPPRPPADTYRSESYSARSRSDQSSQADDLTPPEGVPVGGRERRPGGWTASPPPRRSHRRREEAPQPESPTPAPEPQPEPQRLAWSAASEAARQQDSSADWQPVGSDGQWLPPGTPGSHWTSDPDAKAEPAQSSERRGRHSSPAEPEVGRRARARHAAEQSESASGGPAGPTPAMSSPPPPVPPSPHLPPDREPAMSPPPPPARHRGTDSSPDTDGAHTDGQSVADLLARLQTSPSGGGRRRRRED